MLKATAGLLEKSIKDFSIFPNITERKVSSLPSNFEHLDSMILTCWCRTQSDRPIDPRLSEAFAQYSVVRGYEDDDVQLFGPILKASTKLKEPLCTWYVFLSLLRSLRIE